MDKLFQLKQTIWNYVSPQERATRQDKHRVKRERQLRTKRTSIGEQLDQEAESSATRTYQWLQRPVKELVSPNEPSTAAKKHKNNKVQSGRITKPVLPTPSPSRKSNGHLLALPSGSHTKKTPAYSEPASGEYDLDNDKTLVEESDNEALVEEDNEETLVEEGSAFEQGKDPEDANMNDISMFDEMVEDNDQSLPEKRRKPVDRKELRSQRLAMVNAPAPGWTTDENKLYRLITMRGFEFIFPSQWRMDFNTLPNFLFAYPREAAFFSALSGREFHATNALYRLMSLGKKVREHVLLKMAPEPLIKKEIELYIKWSEQDGGSSKKPHIPLIAFATPHGRGAAQDPRATQHLESQIRRKLNVLASRYRNAFTVQKSVESQNSSSQMDPVDSIRSATPIENQFAHEPPTLYGILVLHTVVAIATFNSANLASPLRTVAILDLGKNGQDVWNGIAIGAVVICARDWLSNSEALKAEKEISEISDDPDA